MNHIKTISLKFIIPIGVFLCIVIGNSSAQSKAFFIETNKLFTRLNLQTPDLQSVKNNIENPNNTILIVSWQAPYTLGRRLADRETEVKIFGERYTRRADVATIGGLSAHAGQTLLREYALSSRKQLKKIFLVHGERGAEPFMDLLANDGMTDVHFPAPQTSVEI